MHIAVLASPDSWYLRDLQRAAGEHRLTQVTFRQMVSALDGRRETVTSGEIALNSVDCILVRTMPPGSLEQVVFRMDVLGRLEAAGKLVINPARAVEAAVDKYLASAKLQAAGLTIPRTMVCQTADDAMLAFATLGGDVVLKPLFGSEGRGIARLTDEALALRAFKMLEELRAVIYLQEFIKHEGADLRVLLIGDQALGMRRSNPLDWRTNVSRGAKAEPLELTDDLVSMARAAAEAIGAPLAGVDLLPGKDGQLYAIEVNAVPGWKALAAVTGVDVARLVIGYIALRLSSPAQQASLAAPLAGRGSGPSTRAPQAGPLT